MSPHDQLANFNGWADAALAANALHEALGPIDEGAAAFHLVAPLARRAINIGRALLQPPAAVTVPSQPHCQAGSVRPASNPQLRPLRTDAPQPVSSCDGQQPSGKVNVSLTLREAREQFEREWIAGRLRDHRGNVSACAAAIGMERSALSRKLRELGLPITREPGWQSPPKIPTIPRG